MWRRVAHPWRLGRLRTLARTSAVVAGATLAAFHGCLFAAQAADGRLEDPWLVFRWLLASGLVAALAAIRQAGGSIWDRQGLSVWVLAALLHGPAVAATFGHSINLAPPEAVATSLLESVMSVSALAATLWLLAGLLGLSDRHARFHGRVGAGRALARIFGDGFSPGHFSRPPPRHI